MTIFPTPALVKARNSLLDALLILEKQRESLIVIGAQAVHERTSHLRMQFTSTEDGDLAVEPELLAASPMVGDLMRSAGYEPKLPDRPGIWCRPGSESESVDLLVPKAFAGHGRRAAKVAVPQGKNVLGMAAGLETALVDNNVMHLESFDRTRPGIEVKVAGPTALICAKSFKLGERVREADAGKRDRVKSKDAGDVLRILLAHEPCCIADTVAKVESLNGERARLIRQSMNQGLAHFNQLFRPGGRGRDLAIESFGEDMEGQIIKACDAWTVHR